MSSHVGKAASSETVTIAGRAVLAAYSTTAIVLLVVEACVFITEPLVEFRTPMFQWSRLPTAVFFAALVGVGLGVAEFNRPKPLRIVGRVVACITAAYAMSVLALITVAAWGDFTDRAGGDRNFDFGVPKPVEDFFVEHQVENPFGLGFWTLITPPAIVALVGIITFLRSRTRNNDRNLTEQLGLPILCFATISSAFLLGSMMAETRFPRGEVDLGAVAFPALPVIVLGALSALAATRLNAPALLRLARPGGQGTIDLGKVLSSASQISVVTLVLLYLGISQISGYASRLSELIQAREAFAFDIVNAHFDDFTSNSASTSDANGRLLKKWYPLPSVPWGKVSIAQYPGSGVWYWVEVDSILSKEKWSARGNRLPSAVANLTQEVADRNGIVYSSSDDALKIYPRIETQLRAKEVALPGAGLSLDLGSFTLLAPFVVFAALVLLGDRARTALLHFARPKDPWILLDANHGLAGVLAWLWLGALAAGPWLLTVLVVQAVALLLRSKGLDETFALDGIATAYIALVLVLLLAATYSAVKSLLILRLVTRSGRT
jgi:hypothetical protein